MAKQSDHSQASAIYKTPDPTETSRLYEEAQLSRELVEVCKDLGCSDADIQRTHARLLRKIESLSLLVAPLLALSPTVPLYQRARPESWAQYLVGGFARFLMNELYSQPERSDYRRGFIFAWRVQMRHCAIDSDFFQDQLRIVDNLWDHNTSPNFEAVWHDLCRSLAQLSLQLFWRCLTRGYNDLRWDLEAPEHCGEGPCDLPARSCRRYCSDNARHHRMVVFPALKSGTNVIFGTCLAARPQSNRSRALL